MFERQKQELGSDALALQAGGNIQIQIGISASEARDIAMDVAKATFFELTGVARDTMAVRVEEITDQVIEKLEKEYPEGLKKALDPDFQYALYTVQRQYGRTGDVDLGALLVDLLVDRSKQDSRGIMQIVLNESLEIAPKLTDKHLATLAIVFLLRYTQQQNFTGLSTFLDYLDEYVEPFASLLPSNNAAFQHLEFTGCASIQAGEITLENALSTTYPALYKKGFSAQRLSDAGLTTPLRPGMLIPCLHNPALFQIGAVNMSVLESMFISNHTPQEDRPKVVELFNENSMTEKELRAWCAAERPYMESVFSAWDDSLMKNLSLTSVGMAIGHANIKRITGEFADLAIWVN